MYFHFDLVDIKNMKSVLFLTCIYYPCKFEWVFHQMRIGMYMYSKCWDYPKCTMYSCMFKLFLSINNI